MTSTMFDVTGFNMEQLAQFQAALAMQKKALREADLNAQTALLQPVADAILKDVTDWQETEHWVGFKAFGIPVTFEGREFTVSVTFTDVAAKATKPKRTRKASAAEAEAEGDSPEGDTPEAPAEPEAEAVTEPVAEPEAEPVAEAPAKPTRSRK